MIAAISINLSSTWWVLLAGLGVPVVVEALTKVHASPRIRAIASIVATAIVGVVASIVTHKGVISGELATSWALAYGANFFSYVGLWKPIVEIRGKLFPDVGLGSNGTAGDNLTPGTVPPEFQ